MKHARALAFSLGACLVLLSVLLVSNPPLARADGGDWPMLRHDLANTGYNNEETELKPPLRLKWSYQTGDSIYSPPVVADGVVYAGSKDGKLYALNAFTGDLKWSFWMGGYPVGTPTVVDGVVYVNGNAFDAATEELKGSAPGWTDLLVAEGVGYFTSGSVVYAADMATGDLKWSYSMGREGSYPAVVGGVVYVASYAAEVFALDAATGQEKWVLHRLRPAGLGCSAPAVANGVVYAIADQKLYAFEASTGAIRWSYQTSEDSCSPSPAVANGVVYVASTHDYLFAVDAATGDLKWRAEAVGNVWSPVAVANGVVYVASRYQNKFYALDATTGAVLWSYTTGASIESFPTGYGGPSLVVANGVVYGGSMDGKVYAFEGVPPPMTMSVPAYVNSSFPISWSAPTTGTTAASYDVEYRDGPSGAWTELVTVTTALSTTFTGVQEAHTYYFRARSRTATDALGDFSQPVSTTVDLTAPVGSVQTQGWSSPYISNTVTLSVSATDSTSGVSQMQFGDGESYGPWEPYRSTGSYLAPPGATAVYGRFKDNVGNISQPVSATITLDNTPPTGSFQAQGWSSPYISNTVALSVSATDSTSGVSQMQFGDGEGYGSWEPYRSTGSYLAPPGATAVWGRFEDNAGNVSQPVSATITLDSTPPTGTLVINGGATYTNNARVIADLSASDDLSGLSYVAFSYDGANYGDWLSYYNRWLVTLPSGDGEKTLYAQFKDRAGNISGLASDSIILDTTPPTTPAPDDGLAGTITSPPLTFQWSAASDALSGVERYYIKVDCGAEAATSALSATAQTLPPDGDHTFYVRARDQAGNYSPYGTHAFSVRATSLDPPDLYAPDSPTDREKVSVGGLGPARVPIRLFLNCAYYGETQSGSYGAWQFRDVPLALGENVIMASIVDSGGGLSPVSLPAVVVRLRSLSGSSTSSVASLLPSSGGTVSAGRYYTVEIPAGALLRESRVVVTPYGAEAAPPITGKRSVGSFASITALERDTGASAQLQRAVRVSLGYDPQALGSVSPSQLSVHYYDPETSSWVALASQVDTANRVVTAEASHLSDFGLLADLPPMPVKAYLPIVAKGYASGW